MRAVAVVLLGLVLCVARARAQEDMALANPFLSASEGASEADGFDAAQDARTADLQLRAARFRLERSAAEQGAGAGASVVQHLPSIMLVETDSSANSNAAAAAAAAVAAPAPVQAQAQAQAPVATAAAVKPAAAVAVPLPGASVPAPSLIETAAPATAAAPKVSDKAPFMPGQEQEEAVEAPKPLPPPAPTSDAAFDTLNVAVNAPAHAAATAAAANDAIADVSEAEASDLLAQVQAVIDGAPRTTGAAHRFAAVSAKHAKARAQHHTRRTANGYGAPGQRDRNTHARRHHRKAAKAVKHHRRTHRRPAHHKPRHHTSLPRFASRTEADLIAEARARAAALLDADAKQTQQAVASMHRDYVGAHENEAQAGAAAEEEAEAEAEVEVETVATDAALHTVRSKRAEYAAHSRHMEHALHRFLATRAEAAAEADMEAEAAHEVEHEHEGEGEAEAEADAEAADHAQAQTEEGAEGEADAEANADAEVEVDAETAAAAEAEAQAQAEAEAEAEAAAAKAKAEAEAKAKAEAATKAAAAAAAAKKPSVLSGRFAQVHVKARHRARAGAGAAPGYGPPLHAPIDTHGSPPVMSSTVDLPLNRPPTPNYFYPPTASPPPAPIQTPRLPSLDPNPAPFAPQFPNADAYRSHQMSPYGEFQRIAPPMQREPPASLYPAYQSAPNFEPAAPRQALGVEMPEPAGGAPSLMEWNAAVHRNTHYDGAAAQQVAGDKAADRPITDFAGFSMPIAQAPAGF